MKSLMVLGVSLFSLAAQASVPYKGPWLEREIGVQGHEGVVKTCVVYGTALPGVDVNGLAEAAASDEVSIRTYIRAHTPSEKYVAYYLEHDRGRQMRHEVVLLDNHGRYEGREGKEAKELIELTDKICDAK